MRVRPGVGVIVVPFWPGDLSRLPGFLYLCGMDRLNKYSMTKEEFDKLWEESGVKQGQMMAEAQAKRLDYDPLIDSPMIQRMLDGSDIL